jgi:peroxiredoxin Q/BCP
MIKIGDKIPDFRAIDQNENQINLSDYLGKKVLLYFYPKDDTPGCTKQACNLRDNFESFIDKNHVILGVSTDSTKSHLKFSKKYTLPFPLLADTDKSIHNIFGTWAEKQTFGKTYMGTVRKSFLIDENGFLERIIEKVETADHTSQIIQ